MSLKEMGIIDHLVKKTEDKYYKGKPRCKFYYTYTKSIDKSRVLELKDFYGVFSIWFGGELKLLNSMYESICPKLKKIKYKNLFNFHFLFSINRILSYQEKNTNKRNII